MSRGPTQPGMTPAKEWAKTDVHKASQYWCAKCGEGFESPHDFYDHFDAGCVGEPAGEARTISIAEAERQVVWHRAAYADAIDAAGRATATWADSEDEDSAHELVVRLGIAARDRRRELEVAIRTLEVLRLTWTENENREDT